MEIDASQQKNTEILKALASGPRIEILNLLNGKNMNLNEISNKLDMPASSVTVNIKKLEESGLIETEYKPAEHGSQKICEMKYDSILINFAAEKMVNKNIIEIPMPIGNYKDFKVKPSCGLATEKGYVGMLDDVRAFSEPDHIYAQIIWFQQGYVKYRFPNNIPANESARNLGLNMEICSEYPNYKEEYASDITLWINGQEIGTWTSPGDFGSQRGKLNPDWWPAELTQHGVLKVWNVDREGSYIDGKRISSVTLDDLGLKESDFIDIKIGVQEDTENVGGLNLFGRKFGNYAQDLKLRILY